MSINPEDLAKVAAYLRQFDPSEWERRLGEGDWIVGQYHAGTRVGFVHPTGYDPVSSIARQAYIDGEDDPVTLRAIDAAEARTPVEVEMPVQSACSFIDAYVILAEEDGVDSAWIQRTLNAVAAELQQRALDIASGISLDASGKRPGPNSIVPMLREDSDGDH